jgi:anti-anti-sigma factor
MFHLTTRSLDPPPVVPPPAVPPPAVSALVVAAIDGEVDATTAEAFARAVGGVAAPAPLILDLTNLKYIDSAGFAALDRLLSERPIVVVLAPHSPIRGAADLVGLPYSDSVDDVRS